MRRCVNMLQSIYMILVSQEKTEEEITSEKIYQITGNISPKDID